MLNVVNKIVIKFTNWWFSLIYQNEMWGVESFSKQNKNNDKIGNGP